jgi:hypothetical protein
VASGTAGVQRVYKYLKKEATDKRSRMPKKLTLALAVGFRKLPVLPQKLLEEVLPGIQRALFKIKRFR